MRRNTFCRHGAVGVLLLSLGSLGCLTALAGCAGTTQSRTLWQRINVMQVMRQLSHDAHIIHFLFCNYDMRQACTLAPLLSDILFFSSRYSYPIGRWQLLLEVQWRFAH